MRLVLMCCLSAAVVGCGKPPVVSEPPRRASDAPTSSPQAIQSGGKVEWATFVAPERNFRFQYPKAWKVKWGGQPVCHYRCVFLTLNSMGADGFQVRNMKVRNGYEYSDETTIQQLPAGAAYMDIGILRGPPGVGDGVGEMESNDLHAFLPGIPSIENSDKQLVKQQFGFRKAGELWAFFVYLRAPFSDEKRQNLVRVLESFRFDGETPARKAAPVE